MDTPHRYARKKNSLKMVGRLASGKAEVHQKEGSQAQHPNTCEMSRKESWK